MKGRVRCRLWGRCKDIWKSEGKEEGKRILLFRENIEIYLEKCMRKRRKGKFAV